MIFDVNFVVVSIVVSVVVSVVVSSFTDWRGTLTSWDFHMVASRLERRYISSLTR